MKLSLFLLSIFTLTISAAPDQNKAWTDPEKATAEDPDFSVQGEYVSKGTEPRMGLQVVALGGGQFDGYLLEGGLPGAGWDKEKSRQKLNGKTEGNKTTLTGPEVSITIQGDVATVTSGAKELQMTRINRKSPTLGAKPPEGAVVLFDGTSADAWEKGKMDGDLLINSDPVSKEKFHSYKLHLEFRTPYKPYARGQKRGNSGVYHQGRYETQVLDSFALEGKMNETGGIYSVSAPSVNACLPPLTWQTYDVDFTAAEWEDGKKVKNARMTVKLNGVLVQDDVEVPKITPAGPMKKESADPGPIYLQHHGNPVRYRNIWVMPK